MFSYKNFEKGRKVMRAEGELRSRREVVEGGVVNARGHSALTASPMPADVRGKSKPAVEVIGNAGTGASGIRFQTAGHRKHSSGQQPVHVSAGIEKGISAEDLPFGSRLILGCGHDPHTAQDRDHYERHNRDTDATGQSAR